jgi:PDZ domain
MSTAISILSLAGFILGIWLMSRLPYGKHVGAVLPWGSMFIFVGIGFPVVIFVRTGLSFIAIWAVGAVFVVLGAGLLVWGASSERRKGALREQGLRGTAVVESVSDTGERVLGLRLLKLQLLVQVPGRAPYRLTHRRRVPDLLIPRLMSGAPVPVFVHPRNQKQLLLDLGDDNPSRTQRINPANQGVFTASPFDGDDLGPDVITVVTSDSHQGARQVLDRMLQGTATIVSCNAPPMPMHTVDGDPVWTFELEVRISDDRPPYRARIADRVPASLPARPRPGLVVDVNVDRNDPAHVAIVWDLGSSGRPGVGIEARTLPGELASRYRLGGGVEIGRVEPGSAAAGAGLRAGDVIVRVDGRGVPTLTDFADQVREAPPFHTFALTVWREGREVPIPLALGH